MIKQCCWRNHSVVKNNDNKWVEWKLFLDSVRIWNADLETKFPSSILRFSLLHWCRERLQSRQVWWNYGHILIGFILCISKPRWLILTNVSSWFYATEMIKSCRYITRIGNSIPLNDPEKQFSCFVWVAVFFFSFFWLFFFPANTAVSLRSLLLAAKRSWRQEARINGNSLMLAFLYPWKQNEEIN